MRGFFTLLIILCSFAGYSQKFMLGVQGGMVFNTAPIGSRGYFTSFESSPQMVVGGKLGIDLRKIQLGVGCQVGSIDYTRQDIVNDLFNSNQVYNYKYSSTIINPYLFLNIKKNLPWSFLYVGVNAGFTRFSSGKDEMFDSKDVRLDYGDAIGTIAAGGLQAGARVKLKDGLGISAEAGMRYTLATPGFLRGHQFNDFHTYKGDVFSFPLTLGIDYIF